VRSARPGGTTVCRFEISHGHGARAAIDRLMLEHVAIVPRAANEAHLVEISGEFPKLAASGAMFVLAGRALAIQRLRRVLRDIGVSSDRVASKAY